VADHREAGAAWVGAGEAFTLAAGKGPYGVAEDLERRYAQVRWDFIYHAITHTTAITLTAIAATV
jgi:hypothetical protein